MCNFPILCCDNVSSIDSGVTLILAISCLQFLFAYFNCSIYSQIKLPEVVFLRYEKRKIVLILLENIQKYLNKKFKHAHGYYCLLSNSLSTEWLIKIIFYFTRLTY